MDTLTAMAASGLRARLESLDLLANNIANAGAAGFKADREFYSTYISPEGSEDTAFDMASVQPLVERRWTDFAQGPMTSTGNPLDLALAGPGFFMIQGPGGRLLTRNGQFHMSASGEVQTSQGYPLLVRGGAPLRINPALGVEVRGNGSVWQGGQAVGQLEIAGAPPENELQKTAGTYFSWVDDRMPTQAPASTEVRQGQLEAANLSAPEGAVRLINVLRQFEMLQRAITMSSEMSRKATEEVARVSP